MSSLSVSLSGMHAAQTRMDASAFNIANAQTPGFRREQVLQAPSAEGVTTQFAAPPAPGAAPEADMADMLRARADFRADVAVFRASARMTGALLDVVA